MTYVAVTLAALIFLNIYCFEVGKRMVYRNKEYALLEKCQLACDELAQPEALTPAAIAQSLAQLESLTASRLIVTDSAATALYDSAGEAVGKHILLPEVLALRCVGRLAVPIFCFLMAEGCARTHDRKRYAARLLGFAVLSEPAFDLMCSGVWFSPDEQNVLWTLLLGALVCWAMDWAKTRP